ncbi:MAG: TrkH family potassium uptake protein [Verrucomicrobia bacterium]|nr:TrkH family potassium uptake protein [Verrucomicrobiota bacterium]
MGDIGDNVHADELSYAVRGRVIGRYVGQLCLVQAVLVFVPLVVALVARDLGFAWRSGASVVVLVVGGSLLGRLDAPRRLQSNEALVISALVFLIAPFMMLWPMMSAGIRFDDALFEAVSGVTTTGLSTAGTIEHRSAAFLFARAWAQWYGGLGVVALSLALVIRPGVVAKRLSLAMGADDDLVAGVRNHTRHVLTVYLVLTGFGFGLLMACGARPFGALTHTLAAVSTGGYSSYDASLVGLGGWPVRAATIFLGLTGAVSFTLYYRARRRLVGDLASDTELRTLLSTGLIVSALLLISIRLSMRMAWGPALGHSLAMGFSAQTTTGFATLDVAGLSAVSKLVLIGAMFIGGDLGSTAGGIKIIRLIVFARLVQVLFQRTAVSKHAVVEPRVCGKRLEPSGAIEALLIVLLFVGVIVVSWILFLAAGHGPLDSLFDVVSATATVGLSTGVTSGTLSPFLKGVLCFDMLAGRLEIVALLVMLYPRTWIGRRRAGP